jgi:hypothetical protein
VLPLMVDEAPPLDQFIDILNGRGVYACHALQTNTRTDPNKEVSA